ncbi:concanavalin A-like lectin/glucanase domain-containing protein [Xylariaceae sp. FL0016]|nr:concanavalin A-like lectin/glucanase domain-containing protein [Xylariaceae sp. FL0016]
MRTITLIMARQITSLALSLAALTGTVQSVPLVSERQDTCDCYKATDASTDFFAHRKFFDFRDRSGAAVPDPIVGRDADAAAGVTNSYFSSAEWTDTWGMQNWATSGGPVYRVNSFNNIYLAPDTDDSPASNTHLVMRTLRQDDYQSTAEFESVSGQYQYLSMRMLARTRGDSGACTSMFTYLGSDPVQEADLEIRTLTGTSQIQYTNQPSLDAAGNVVDAATRVVDAATPWTQWQEHRHDWTPAASAWYVDGAETARISFQVPTGPLTVLFNAWSDGGEWSGVMAAGGEAEMQIQWIDLTYNNTAEPAASACSNVCSVDSLIG